MMEAQKCTYLLKQAKVRQHANNLTENLRSSLDKLMELIPTNWIISAIWPFEFHFYCKNTIKRERTETRSGLSSRLSMFKPTGQGFRKARCIWIQLGFERFCFPG